VSDFKVSVTGSIGEGQYTFHGDTVAEVVQATADLAASIGEILDNLAVVKQGVMAKDAFTVKKVAKDAAPAAAKATSGAGGSSTQAASVAPPGSIAPSCDHGKMEFKSGTSKAGKAYKLWSCTSTDRAEQCKAEFVK